MPHEKRTGGRRAPAYCNGVAAARPSIASRQYSIETPLLQSSLHLDKSDVDLQRKLHDLVRPTLQKSAGAVGSRRIDAGT
jgi:hypothetical protein